MKYLITILLIIFLTSCSTLEKPKVKEVLADIQHAVEILNEKYCQEKVEPLRQLLIAQIRHYVPFYPEEGYCLFVGDNNNVK